MIPKSTQYQDFFLNGRLSTEKKKSNLLKIWRLLLILSPSGGQQVYHYLIIIATMGTWRS